MILKEGTVTSEAFEFQLLEEKKGQIMQLHCFQLPVSENLVLFFEDRSLSLIANFLL